MENKTPEGITVVGVKATNFHRLEVANVRLVAGGGLVRVTGDNASGKTSLLRAIKAALGGAGEVLGEAVVNDGSPDGTGDVVLKLSNGFTVERRFTDANPKGYLTVIGPDGGTHKQGKLNEWVGSMAFDPLAFFGLHAKKQADVILSLSDDPTLPDRVAKLRARRQGLYTERTPWISRRRALSSIVEPEGTRPTPEDVTPIIAERQALEQKVEERRAAATKATLASMDLHSARDDERATFNAVARLRQSLVEAEATYEKKKGARLIREKEVDTAAAELDALPDVSDQMSDVLARLDAAAAAQVAVGPWRAYDRKIAEREEATEKERTLSDQIAAIDAEEAKALAELPAPVPGLTVTEDGPMLNGRPLVVASGAERIRLAVAVAIAANPDLRVALVDEANDIDTAGLEALDALAKAHDFQVWAARIGLEGPGEVVVTDGKAFTGATDD